MNGDETMIRVIEDGERRHRLEDRSGRHIGWIRGHVVGFRGLPSERRAVDSAFVAWQALEGALGKHYFGWKQPPVSRDRLKLVHDGAYEWVSDGDIPLARLYRPPADMPQDSFAIEVVLPSFASEGAAICVAQTLGTAIAPYRDDADSATSLARHDSSSPVSA
jgi:hypothetical protein